MTPLPESAVELAARAMCKRSGCTEPCDFHRRAIAEALTAALPAIREAVVGECVLIDKGAIKMVENVLRRAGKDEVADEMLSAIGLAALTEQENRNDQERSHDGG